MILKELMSHNVNMLRSGTSLVGDFGGCHIQRVLLIATDFPLTDSLMCPLPTPEDPPCR